MRRSFVLLAAMVAIAPLKIRAENSKQTAPTSQKTATAPARDKSQILADLSAAGKAFRDSLHDQGTKAFTDEKTRREIAPKAIPAMRKYLAVFDELTQAEPRAKAQRDGVYAQFDSMLATLGDADAEKELKEMAQGKGDSAIQAQSALLMTRWWRSSTDEASQKKVLEDATALLKANPEDYGVAASMVEMGDVGAATSQLRDAALQAVLDNVKGEGAARMIEQIKSSQKLAAMENKPLVLAGMSNDGKTFSTADWKGKVILVDFWATWCGPCKEELPRVKKAYADFHAMGFEVLGVSCDNSGADLKKFLGENPDMPWPQLFDEKTAGWHPLAKQFGITGIPTMFLIDKKGVLRTVEARSHFEELIPKMLAE